MKYAKLPNTREEAAECTEITGSADLSSYGHALPKLASIGRDADLRSYAHALPLMMKGVPKIKHLDKKILERIEANPKCFDMSKWHCGTTHCRAGHAIDLAGENGYALEKKFSPSVAGALIYMASCPGKEVPNFNASNEDALADIKRRAK